jgi:NADH dehydrogenase [ubiquinone] 1 alpha subcomplex assembly factor 3
MEPRLDILVLGIGDAQPAPAFRKEMFLLMKKHNINIEVMTTESACTTFNFLNAESRLVAAALIPPTTLSVNEDDYAKYMFDRQNIAKLEM